MPDLARFGPFFAVQFGEPDPGGSWQRMDSLVTDPAALASRVERVRAALAQRAGQPAELLDIRVAVSVAHLGLVARLIAPQIGLAVMGQPSSWPLENLWWRDELGGPYPLSVGSSGTGEPAFETITLGMLELYPVSPQVLWGNVGSATNSAAQMISRARPDLAAQACRVADAVLADPRIDGGILRSQPRYRRNSCCLIYRISSGSNNYCGDCVLVR